MWRPGSRSDAAAVAPLLVAQETTPPLRATTLRSRRAAAPAAADRARAGSGPDDGQQAQAAIDKAAAEQAALDSQQQLEEIEASISVSTDRAEELKLEIEEMKGDRARQNAALIAAGQRVKLAETDIAALEAAARRPDRRRDRSPRPARRRRHQHLQRARGARAHLAQPAAGADRRSLRCAGLGPQRHPDLGHPAAARRQRPTQVTADLTRLTDIKAAALAEETQLQANFAILEEEQLRIATLIVARKQGETIITAELAAEEAEAPGARRAGGELKDLIAS